MESTIQGWLISIFALSYREAEIAELTGKGFTNKETANLAFITEKTVKYHLTHVYQKMGIKSRSELIVTIANERTRRGQVDETAKVATPARYTEHTLPTGK